MRKKYYKKATMQTQTKGGSKMSLIHKLLSRFSETHRIRHGFGIYPIRNKREAKALYDFCMEQIKITPFREKKIKLELLSDIQRVLQTLPMDYGVAETAERFSERKKLYKHNRLLP